MDYFYQQKLINEKNQLQRQLMEANHELKQLKALIQEMTDILGAEPLEEGQRRVERIRRAEEKNFDILFAGESQEGALRNVGINPDIGPVADALMKQREQIQARGRGLRRALTAAEAKVDRSLHTRAASASLEQAKDKTGKPNPQLARVERRLDMKGSPYSAADINMDMAKRGQLPKAATKRLLGTRPMTEDLNSPSNDMGHAKLKQGLDSSRNHAKLKQRLDSSRNKEFLVGNKERAEHSRSTTKPRPVT